MQSKLTLRLDDVLIKEAKAISEAEGKSLSLLVSDYFQLLSKTKPTKLKKLHPLTRSLRGALKGTELSELDYKNHLEQKHL